MDDPFESQPTMFVAPAAMMILAQATPEAPTPFTTIRSPSTSLSRSEGVDQGRKHDDGGAVLVVMEDGMSSSFFRRSSTSKHRGPRCLRDLCRRTLGLDSDGLDYRVRILVSRQIGNASTFANCLKSAALPSITGIAARGPMSPRPSTAVPSETTATVFR